MSGKFSFTGAGELRVRSGGRALVATGDVIVIGAARFRLVDVDRVAYHAADRPGRVAYSVGLAAGEIKSRFVFDAFRRDTEFDETSETWRRLVDLLEATACPRIADALVASIKAGETVRFGGALSPWLDADAKGLCSDESKPLAWKQITGTDIGEGDVRVFAGGTEPVITIGTFG